MEEINGDEAFYEILAADSVEKLVELVEDHVLNGGWSCQGGVAVVVVANEKDITGFYLMKFYQAMVKEINK